jgi:hypothetical protein
VIVLDWGSVGGVASELDLVELALLELQFYTRIGRRLKEEGLKYINAGARD